ncbi:MAG: hypothetical protein JWM48_1472 [Mycobacterium sp.]|nr:hypothetical protein [Mycobacterium sp.]MCW2744922.1 hypothetical protein [Mycobacterium sp.]
MRVLGVDGCPGGWVGALVDTAAPAGVRWLALADPAAVLAAGAAHGVAATGIDMPIGLPDGPEPRAADAAARTRLGPRRSSVFPTPARAVLAATSYEQACALSARAAGRRLSVQAWNIVDRIRALDAVLTPDLQRRVVEVHPEVSFAALAGAPLAAPKKVAAGRAAREAALAGWFAELDIPATAVTAPRGTPGRPDDRLDALACAWSALRWARGVADVLPCGHLGDPPRDSRGLRCEIVV